MYKFAIGKSVLIFVILCSSGNAFSEPPLLVPVPGPSNNVLPILNKPYNGDFQISNFLDHNVPQEFVDSNGVQINYWGETTSFFDGHQGYDFLMPVGTPLLATASGQIVFAGAEAPFFARHLTKP